MSVSGLKAELKFLASIFDKNHERFRIVSWKLDELHCQFLLPPPAPPGSPHSPSPPLTLHCNITVRRPASAPRSQARAERGARVPGQKGIGPVGAPWLPGSRAGRIRPFPGQGALPRPSLASARLGWEEAGGAFLRSSRGAGSGTAGPLSRLLRASVWETVAALALARSPWLPTAGLPPDAARHVDSGFGAPAGNGEGRPSSFNALLFSEVSFVLLIHPVVFKFVFKEN